MTHVATLISNPQTPAVDDEAVSIAAKMLPVANGIQWLDPNIAVDIFCRPDPSGDHRLLADAIRAALGERPIDVVVQPIADRRKALLLADMDSTMIGQECIDELADFVGLKDKVATITEAAMRGELVFEAALRERVALLKGLPPTVVDSLLSERIGLTPGGRALAMTMRAHGAYTCLVSGGFSVFTRPIATKIGFDEDRSNTLLLGADGTLTGTVAEPIFGRDGKLATLVELKQRFGLQDAQTMAIGDGANDLAMIEQAGLGVAYHAKPKVREGAAARIDHGDLTAALYLQGYPRSQFTEQ